ncbi:MAG: hypothetical protein QOI73_2622, partial [Solirubrobacteraceae bacterium]|nr:hypothetical protein [Solirubrobacteraceae bacterium]
ITAAAAAEDRSPRRNAATTSRQRLLALGAIATLVVAIAIVVAGREPDHPLARGDASFIGSQLATADQRVRVQLPLLSERGTARALDRTRDAIVTTRSLSIEMQHATGDDAERLRRALRQEAAWLDAVGSTLSNPSSPLREQLVARDHALRGALSALPGPLAARAGDAGQVVAYAKARAAAGDHR